MPCAHALVYAYTYESFGSRSPGQIDNRTHSHHTFIRERAHRDSEKYSLCVVDQRDNIIIYLFFFIYNFFFLCGFVIGYFFKEKISIFCFIFNFIIIFVPLE